MPAPHVTQYLWQETYPAAQLVEMVLQTLAEYTQTLVFAAAVLAAVVLVMIGLLALQEDRASKRSRRLVENAHAHRTSSSKRRLPARTTRPTSTFSQLQAP